MVVEVWQCDTCTDNQCKIEIKKNFSDKDELVFVGECLLGVAHIKKSYVPKWKLLFTRKMEDE